MEVFKKILLSCLLIGVAVAALAYIFIFHVQDRGVHAKDGWLFDLEGYYQAISRSRFENQPILLYVRRKACQRCLDFEKDFLNNSALKPTLSEYIKVQINMDTDRRHERFADQFGMYTYPSLFVLNDPDYAVSTFLVLATQQIWVPMEQHLEKGNFMPLSETSFRLALERAKIRALQPPSE